MVESDYLNFLLVVSSLEVASTVELADAVAFYIEFTNSAKQVSLATYLVASKLADSVVDAAEESVHYQ